MAKEDNGRAPKKVSTLDKLVQTALGQNRQLGSDEDPAREAYPLLWDFLSRTDAGKDYIIAPGKLTLTLGPEGVIASLSHQDLKVSMDVGCKFLGEALAALEADLQAGAKSLRQWGGKQPNLRKRKKEP